MKTLLIFVASIFFNSVQCNDSESLEYNGIEVSPLYETIIYSDIADIIKELDNNNPAFEKTNNESESDENVEDLLSEYHHYLEKAHKQRVNFLEKNKLKNKVPAIRHEKFTKMNSPAANSHKDHYKNSFFNSEIKFPPVLNPFNMFIPFNSNKYFTSSEPPSFNNGLSAFRKGLNDESFMLPYSDIPVKASCSCKDGRASCKQCFMPVEHMQPRTNPAVMLPSDDDKTYLINNPLFPEQLDDTINVRIKVDVQLPKLQPDHVPFYNLQSRDKMSEYDVGVSKEYLSAIKLPSPYFDFPIPMNLFGYKKITKTNKHDMSPVHKITIHKKKKSKVGSSNKKHRKKVISFHNIKIEPQIFQSQFEPFNVTFNGKNESQTNDAVMVHLHTDNTYTEDANLTTRHPLDHLNVTETQTEENILLLVNITNNIENGTNEKHKAENSIETEYTNVISNATTDKPLHLLKKRELPTHDKPLTPQDKSSTQSIKSITLPKTSQNKSTTPKNKPLTKSTISQKKSMPTKKKTITKDTTRTQKSVKNDSTLIKLDKGKSNHLKFDKSMPSDTELLYWPIADLSKSRDGLKNTITAIILANENKKAKLNLSTETLHRNHTRALEQAIFGNVDWNDVDSVAPAFISFVGKYIEGILTFCNERICHSMKCTKKTCLHRYCAPNHRFNNKGHCTGSNYTDSVVSMESIMNLPSNVAFEIVDVLENRMIGKLFGKMTLCINAKCKTFATSKKAFYKNKCLEKELSPTGHCVSSKELKIA